jgi:hypothetical protein
VPGRWGAGLMGVSARWGAGLMEFQEMGSRAHGVSGDGEQG